jgi:hypothetical protein
LQNLQNAHMYVWVPDASKVIVPNKSEEFFREFSDYITVRQFDYDDAIQGTPFKGDPFFGNGTLVKSSMPAAGSYSDIVRILILNKYGGEWVAGGRVQRWPQAQCESQMHWDSLAADNMLLHANITAGCCCIQSLIGSCRSACLPVPTCASPLPHQQQTPPVGCQETHCCPSCSLLLLGC